MRHVIILIMLSCIVYGCEKREDSDLLFNKAEGFVKLNMYKEALDIYIELKERNHRTDIVEERIKMVSAKLAEERLRHESVRLVEGTVIDAGTHLRQVTGSSGIGQSFKVSRCDEGYNERIMQIKSEMKPYLDEMSEIEKRLAEIGSKYKVVSDDGGYSFAVPADTPRERQMEIAEGPARDFGTLMARKNELMIKINEYTQDINAVFEDAKKAGQPSDCIKR